jgi:hypothetical protein
MRPVQERNRGALSVCGFPYVIPLKYQTRSVDVNNPVRLPAPPEAIWTPESLLAVFSTFLSLCPNGRVRPRSPGLLFALAHVPGSDWRQKHSAVDAESLSVAYVSCWRRPPVVAFL